MTPAAQPAGGLDELNAKLQDQNKTSGHVTLEGTTLKIIGLDDLLGNTLGRSLPVTNVSLMLSPQQLEMTGQIAFLNTPFHLDAVFSIRGGLQASIGVKQVAGSTLSLKNLAGRLMPHGFSLPPQTPDLTVGDLEGSLETSSGAFTFGGSLTWPIALGQRIIQTSAAVKITRTSGALSSSLQIGTAAFSVSYDLNAQNQVLTGSWTDPAHALGYDSIAAAAGIDAQLSIPDGVPRFGFHSATLTVHFVRNTVVLTGQGDTGQAFFSAEKQPSGSWGFTFGIALAPAFRLSSVIPALGLLDFLTFNKAFFVVSSITATGYKFEGFGPLVGVAIDLAPGLCFGAEIDFKVSQDPRLKAVNKVIGKDTLFTEGILTRDPKNCRLKARIAGDVHIASNLILADPSLVIVVQPLAIDVQGDLHIPVKDQVLNVLGTLAFSANSATFLADVSAGKGKSLTGPLGFSGVSLTEIGVGLGIAFTPPGITLELDGTFVIGSSSTNKCALAFQVVPSAEPINPILFWGQFPTIDLKTIAAAVVRNLNLPPLLSAIGFKNVYVYACEQPTTLPDRTSCLPGFGVAGEIDIFNFVAKADLKIDSTKGIAGSAAMSPIHLGAHIVDITGSSPLGGPSVAVNTVSAPFLKATLDAQVLEVVGAQVQATVDSSGFSFVLDFSIQGVLSEKLSCTLKDRSSFAAATDLHFKLNVDAGPIMAPITNINLGTIHIHADFAGHMDMSASLSGASGHVNGTFDGRTLPSLAFNESIGSLKKIPDLVLNQIKSHAQQIYQDVLSDANKWAGALQSGLITGASDAANVLTSYFGQSKSSAEAILKLHNLHGSASVHVDANSPHLDSPHGDIPSKHSDSGVHVDTHGDTSPFGIHADTHHVDTPRVNVTTPHGDTPKVDTRPHVDTSQHVDV